MKLVLLVTFMRRYLMINQPLFKFRLDGNQKDSIPSMHFIIVTWYTFREKP